MPISAEERPDVALVGRGTHSPKASALQVNLRRLDRTTEQEPAKMSTEMDNIAKQFTDFYYQTFDSNRAALSNLYRDGSMLTWESTQILGVSAIMEKLSGLPFSTVQHQITTLDAQPASSTTASLLVLVTGKLVIDGDNVLQYSQMFHLVPEGGSYFVQNDVFRLVYG